MRMIKFILNKRNLGLFALLFSIVMAVLVVLAVVRPAVNRQIGLFEEKRQLTLRRDAIAKTLANLKATDYKLEQERLSGIDLLIPDRFDFLPSLSLIEFLAQNRGLSVLANRAGGASQNNKEATGLPGFLIQSSFEGEYPAVKSFLAAIYLAKRAIGISSAALGGQADETRVALTATFFLPVVTEKPQTTSLESGVSTLSSEDNVLIASLQGRTLIPVSTASATFGKVNPFAKP